MSTVEQYFADEKIEKRHLWDIQEESDYWEKAGLFCLDNWEEEVSSLSFKQFTWLERIREDLTEKRILGKI